MTSAGDASPLPLPVREGSLVKLLSQLRDPQARFAWLVEQARQRPPLPDFLRTDTRRVEGCLVRLWWVAEARHGRCWFRTDSDAVTLRAVCGLLADLSSGATPAELASWRPDFLERLGLLRQFADNRRATIGRVIERIRAFGAAQVGTAEEGGRNEAPASWPAAAHSQ